MNGWIIFSICITIVCLFSTSKLLVVRWDIKKMTEQLKTVNEHFGTNELVRTNTHDKHVSYFVREINQLIHLYKENERYLAKQEAQLKTEITNISHDLRTPLTSIKGFSQLLVDDDVSTLEKKKYLEIIQRKIQLLTTQVDLFYELSSLDSDDYKLEMKSLSLDKVIEEKMLLFYHDFEKQGLDVQLSNLQETFVLANEKAVERIVINIIQNALRYARSYFHVTLQETGSYICFEATNDTTELKEADVSSIFNRSYRKDSSRRSGQLGLGLHIVQKLLEKQGGEVTAHMDGNRFTLRLFFYKRM